MEGKRSASGDLKIYPPNLLSMDWAFLPGCSRSNTALSLISETDDGHAITSKMAIYDYGDGEDRKG